MKLKTPKAARGRTSFLASASVAAAAAAALGGAPAHAQDADEGEAIIVTGSRIPQPNLYTTSPVTQVTAEDITTQGVTRIEDLTNQLPQVFAGQGSNISNGAFGTATVDLRGLGPARTLVLIDGRRMGIGSPNSTPADLNQIPGPLVERVEVLTGGASAAYGSDAIAGVVNFIMRDNFEGFRLDTQYGFYQHSNDSDDGYIREVLAARAATNPAQFQIPDDNQDDGFSREATAIFGVTSEDGRGNVTAYLGYRNNEQVLQRDRDYSACTVANGDTSPVPGVPAGALHWTCGGSATSYPGLFTDFSTFAYTIDQTTGGFVPFSNAVNQYNYGPLNYYQRPDERYTLGAFAHYAINDHVEAYANVMFNDYRSVSQIAPSGDFFSTASINCGNPLLTAANAAAIGCSGADIAADNPAALFIGRRNVEGGGRRDDLNYEAYRGVIGLRGPLTDNWDYDVFGQYYRVSLNRSYQNDFSITRLNRALDVVDADPGPGVDPQCRSFVDGVDLSCVPWDVFTPNGVTPDALRYLQIPLLQRGEAIQQNLVATITGDAGIHSPWATSNLAASFGVEYRRDAINTVVDENFSTGNASGLGGPTLPLSGDTDVFEVFGEARLPLVEGAPLAELLSIDAAYRRSHYNTGIDTDTYKVGLEWAPTSDIRFRGSYQRAVRAANIVELFASQGFGLFDMDDDPCAADVGGDGIAAAAACVGVNPWQVTAGQYGSGGLNNPAGQYNGLFGGNTNLAPEEADTYTLGLVFTPGFLPGLNLSIDYFNIEVADLVSVTGAVNTLNDCYFNNSATSCARIIRNPGTGQLWVGQGRVEDLNTNIGGLSTSGFDINASYSMDIGDAGSLGIALVGTHLDDLTTDPGIPGFAPYNCVGGMGAALCGTPAPEWRHRLRVSWETPWDLELFGTWRYFGGVERRDANNAPVPNTLDSNFGAENYFDLAGNWQVRENTQVRFGVNNVLDNDPPLSANVPTGAGNGNTYPQVYDALGRWVFVGLTVDF